MWEAFGDGKREKTGELIWYTETFKLKVIKLIDGGTMNKDRYTKTGCKRSVRKER